MLPEIMSTTLVMIGEVESLSHMEKGVPQGVEDDGPRIEEIGPVDMHTGGSSKVSYDSQ